MNKMEYIFVFNGICKFNYKNRIKVNGYDYLFNSLFSIDFEKNIKGLKYPSDEKYIENMAKIVLENELSNRLKDCSYTINCEVSYFEKLNYCDEAPKIINLKIKVQ